MAGHRISISTGRASFLQLVKDPVAFFKAVSQIPHDVAEIRMGPRRFYVVKSPELIRDFLVTQAASFEKFPAGNPNQKLFGNGLLTSEDPLHKQQRRALQPAFRRDRLRIYAEKMVAAVESLGASWRNGANVDISAAMNTLTLSVITETLFAMTDPTPIAELGKQLHVMLQMVNRFVLPGGNLLMRLPLPSSRRYRGAMRRLDEIVVGLIRSAIAEQQSESLTAILLATRRPDGVSLTPEEVRDEIVTMIVAGHETVAVGLSWCFYLLAQNPDIQEGLARQTRAILRHEQPTVTDYERLAFLHNAFAESLRLFPPIWILGRRALTSYSFGNFRAKKGSVFLVCMADLHRRAEFFDRADEFRPERWLTPSWPYYAYLPFGAGERRCIGERFAWMEGVFFLACLLRRWRFELLDQQAPSADAKLTLNPRSPIRLRVFER